MGAQFSGAPWKENRGPRLFLTRLSWGRRIRL